MGEKLGERHLHHGLAEGRHTGGRQCRHRLVDIILVALAEPTNGSNLSAPGHGAFLGRLGVRLALGAAYGDRIAPDFIAGRAFRAVRVTRDESRLKELSERRCLLRKPDKQTEHLPMLRAHACSLGILGAARELAQASLGSMRDADAALNDSVDTASHGAGTFGGLFFYGFSDDG